MSLKSIIIGISAVVFLSFGSLFGSVDPAEKEKAILDSVLKFLELLHIQPKDINDEFSKTLHKTYLESLDPGKRFLLAAEIEQLNRFELLIDDQINERSFDYFDASIKIINDGISRGKTYFDEVINDDLDLSVKDYIEMDYDKRAWASDEDELRQVWLKSIKYDVLGKLDQKLEDQETDTTITTKLSFEELKAEAVKETKKSYDDWFKRLDQVRRSDRFENYINSITHIFDPHTDYYNPKEKEDFDIRMGGKLTGIGARLSPEGDYIRVVSIIPGGPAWKGKDLEVDDVIYSVQQEDQEIPMEIQGMRMDDVVSKIRGDVGTEVTLKVKGSDGTFRFISIVREEVIIDEGFARSVILDLPDVADNIGYILLPKFYSSFEGKEGNSCSKDVAIEIEKLKRENVNGIILDLRNNGGGSLQDVISMSGLFIEDGPIVQVQDRVRKAHVYKDKDADVKYDGPLIVMVNQHSASASEILAAALQDYERAVIVGSNSTFGKGTVQRFENLDKYIRGYDDVKPLGQLKITMQKFYRVNGGSTQLNGVESDIVLPDAYTYLDSGEKEYEFPIGWSEIEAVEYDQNVFELDQMDDLVAKSQERINSNETFQLIDENAKRLKESRESNTFPLAYDEFKAFLDQREEQAEQFKDIMKDKIDNLSITNLEEDLEKINSDESRKARNDDWVKNLSKDVYVEEVLHIMKDLQAKA